MNMILGVLVLAVAWNCVNTASVAQEINGCVEHFYGRFNFGRTALTTECGVAFCKEDGKLDINICPAISVAPGSIIIPQDLSKPFPKCCEQVIKSEDAKPCENAYYGTFSIGEHALTTKCGKAICKPGGKLEIDQCPAISVAPGSIIIPEDLSKPHPECCEQVIKAEDAKPCENAYYGTFSIGEHALTTKCGKAICKPGGKLEIDQCPAISVAPGSIIIPEDLSKPHPECCEQVIKAEDAEH